MKPILFAETATTFNTNGIGRIDCISCKVTEEKNGIYELQMEVAEDADHVSEIQMSSIIIAQPAQGKSNQPFRVYKMTKPINGRFTVYAHHISYQLSFIPVMPFAIIASSSACNQTLQGLKTYAVESCPFTFWTDVTTVASYEQTVPASLRSRLGGVAGSVLDRFGGEFEWDWYTVKLWRNRGITTPQVSLRYGKNITDLNQEENIENTVTGIVPYWQSPNGDTTVTLPEKVVESSYASRYPFKRTIPYDFSQDFDDPPTQAQLRARAQAYVNQSGLGVPKVSIKLSFINLSDTEDYKDIAALQAVNLCDYVGVYFEKLNISTSAEVVKTVWNCLSERYDSIEIGALRGTLASTVSGNTTAITNVANGTKEMFAQYNQTVNEFIDNATSWLTGSDGFVMAVKNNDGSWKELLFMDTADAETAHNVLRINENGIGFSSTGVAGPYTQAWTLDGRLVIGGTNVPSLTVYDNSTPPKILFQINKDGMEWNATNSSMTKAGVIKAIGAILENAQITSWRGTGSNKYSITIEDGEITFSKGDVAQASINYRAYGNQSHLDIGSDSFLTLNSSNGHVSIFGQEAVDIDTRDELRLKGNIWIDPSPSSTYRYQLLAYISGNAAPIQDFDWDYDYDTGCINSLSNFVRRDVWG